MKPKGFYFIPETISSHIKPRNFNLEKVYCYTAARCFDQIVIGFSYWDVQIKWVNDVRLAVVFVAGLFKNWIEMET